MIHSATTRNAAWTRNSIPRAKISEFIKVFDGCVFSRSTAFSQCSHYFKKSRNQAFLKATSLPFFAPLSFYQHGKGPGSQTSTRKAWKKVAGVVERGDTPRTSARIRFHSARRSK